MHIRSVRAVIFALVLMALSAACFAQTQIGVMITFAPPPLPEYDQPVCPAEGYIWTPGYWAYGDDFDDYYWVPGTWVEAPEVGFLWTPGYWGWSVDRFVFSEGYWGPQVGFYGGINYGYGYFGNGYDGGRWDHDHFFYNRAVNHVNVTVIHNVYNTKVVNVNRTYVSYNGGNGGIDARPRPEQEAASRGRHIPPVSAQTQHVQAARSDTQLRASINRGKPAIAATDKPADFKGGAVVKAKKAGGNYTPPPPNRRGNPARDNAAVPRPENNNSNNSNADRAGKPMHAADLPAATRSGPPNTGDAKRDQKFQQQQEKQTAKQEQERQKLQQRQQQEDQKVAKRADDARKQQVEQRHQQQTEKLQQRHEQQQQKLQQREQPANRSQPKPDQPKPEKKNP